MKIYSYLVGRGSFGTIKKVRRRSDGKVRSHGKKPSDDTVSDIPTRSWSEKRSAI